MVPQPPHAHSPVDAPRDEHAEGPADSNAGDGPRVAAQHSYLLRDHTHIPLPRLLPWHAPETHLRRFAYIVVDCQYMMAYIVVDCLYMMAYVHLWLLAMFFDPGLCLG